MNFPAQSIQNQENVEEREGETDPGADCKKEWIES